MQSISYNKFGALTDPLSLNTLDAQSSLRQMGSGSSSSLQAQPSVVVAIEINYRYPVSTSKQTKFCETNKKEGVMKRKCTVTKTSVESRTNKVSVKLKLCYSFMVAILVSGYGNGFSPSALGYSKPC